MERFCKNKYLKNLNKIEFVVTDACNGRCKHCSEGEHSQSGARIDPEAAADAVRKIAELYDIRTVMTFGGEPLLHTDAVEAIITAAREMMIPQRQLITNGCFSNDPHKVRAIVSRLAECGVNDLLLSVDSFHQQTLPLDVARTFALEVKAHGIPIKLSPAWLVSEEDFNPYNLETRKILDSLRDTGIPVGKGNVIFPEGNALVYLSEYFTDELPENPYVEDPCDVRCISFSANGDVLGKNLYRDGILKILRGYAPK